MDRARFLTGAVVMVWLLAIATCQVTRVLRSPSDGIFVDDVRDPPSHLYITENVPPAAQPQTPQPPQRAVRPEDSVRIGDLLLSIEGRKVTSLAGVHRILQTMPPDSALHLEVFRPSQGTTHTHRVAKAALPEPFLRELSPAVYVSPLRKGGPAERAGIQQGDLLLRINGQSFTPSPEVDPIVWLNAALAPLYSRPVTNALAAERIMLRTGIGRTLAYEVIRDNRPLVLPVTLTAFGIPTVLVFGVSLGALASMVAGASMAALGQRRPMVQLLGWGLLLLGFLLSLAIKKDAEYDSLALMRDTTVWVLLWLLSKGLAMAGPGTATALASAPAQWRQRLHFLPPAILAAGLLWGLYVWHVQTPLPEDVGTALGYGSLAGLRVKLFARGPIPPLICWTFFFGLLYLQQIWRHKLRPLLPTHVQNRSLCQVASAGDIGAVIAEVNAQATSGQFGYYGRRVYQLIEHLNRDPDWTGLQTWHNELLTQDEDDASRAFVPVTWCETALPLGGFLGTIMGMGDAIGALAHAVLAIFAGTPSAALAQDFTKAFQGMGEAFDTTFWGLAGVLMLSMADRALRKRMAAQLAEGREFLGRVISQWSASSVAGGLGGLQAELEHARVFRETMLTLLERVITEVPAYTEIRDVLFEPMVVFEEVARERNTALQKHITAQLDNAEWDFVSVGLSVSAAYGGVVAVRYHQSTTDRLLRFTLREGPQGALLQTESSFTHLFPSHDLHTVLGRTISGEVMLLSLPAGGDGAVEMTSVLQGEDRLRVEDRVFQVTVAQRDVALMVRQTGLLVYEVHWQEIRPHGSHGSLSLPGGVQWSLWAVHAPSATLLAAGQTENRWHLLRLPIKNRSSSADRAAPLGLFTEFNRRIDLPAGLIPQQLVALPRDALLILDTEGTLHYWNPTRQLRPLPPHPDWVHRTRYDPFCEIRSGSGNWIAVVAHGDLSMWWVSRSGAFTPYVKERRELKTFPITDRDAQHRLQVTADGSYLLTATRQTMPSWAFPRTAIDNLT